jgi:hypothetical protein
MVIQSLYMFHWCGKWLAVQAISPIMGRGNKESVIETYLLNDRKRLPWITSPITEPHSSPYQG